MTRHDTDDVSALAEVLAGRDLSERQRLGAVMIARGDRQVDVADALDVDPRTVRRWRDTRPFVEAVAAVGEALASELAAACFRVDRLAVDAVARAIEDGDAVAAVAWLRLRNVGEVRRPRPVEPDPGGPVDVEALVEALNRKAAEVEAERTGDDAGGWWRDGEHIPGHAAIGPAG